MHQSLCLRSCNLRSAPDSVWRGNMQYWVVQLCTDYQGADISLQGHSSARHLLSRPPSYIAPVIWQSDHFILIARLRLLGSRVQGNIFTHLGNDQHCPEDNVQAVWSSLLVEVGLVFKTCVPPTHQCWSNQWQEAASYLSTTLYQNHSGGKALKCNANCNAYQSMHCCAKCNVAIRKCVVARELW